MATSLLLSSHRYNHHSLRWKKYVWLREWVTGPERTTRVVSLIIPGRAFHWEGVINLSEGSLAIAQKLCESRGVRTGLPVPDKPDGFCGSKATLKRRIFILFCNGYIALFSSPWAQEHQGMTRFVLQSKVREQWCRRNSDLRVINARKQAFSVVPKASPWRWKSCAHMCTTSLWGVAAKWLVATW